MREQRQNYKSNCRTLSCVSKQYVSYVFRKHDSPLHIAIKIVTYVELGSIQKVVEKYGITESHRRSSTK